MRRDGSNLHLSASDLAGHLGCRHLSELNRLTAEKKIAPPSWHDPMLEVLLERGLAHEHRYLDHLRSQDRDVVEILGIDITEDRARETAEAMQAGAGAIAQASLLDGGWRGRADVLLRCETPSPVLGAWSYEVVDTKLASETRAGTILQLCLYSELVARIQGRMPEHMYVVSPDAYSVPERFRTHDFLAYHRRIKGDLAALIGQPLADPPRSYPEPVGQCDVCRWWKRCDQRRRDDDHPSLVAGVTRLQRRELALLGIDTLTKLAGASLPLSPRPARGSSEGYVRVREQARLQLASRGSEVPRFEHLDPEEGRGLALLPAPSPGDVFFDFEGDPFVAAGGREYLFGWIELRFDGTPEYHRHWALDAEGERHAFESVVDRIFARLKDCPGLHVYHFGGYETGAFKRLMGRYATREDEIDRLLRGRRFVDLHSVVRRGLRVGIERYSLKDLERLHGFARTLELREASAMLRSVERFLELGQADSITEASRTAVESYNRDDCLSTFRLRGWLEDRRTELESRGVPIPRPAPTSGDPSESLGERQDEVQELYERLMHDIPVEPADRSEAQQARWILAHMLDWHRREDKAVWWEYYRLGGLSAEEMLEEKAGLGGLEWIGRVGGTLKCPIDRYRFVEQEHGVGAGKDLCVQGPREFGSLKALDDKAWTIDIKKRQDTADEHPPAVFVHDYVRPKPKPESLQRLAAWVAAPENGIDAPGDYRAARDLLLKRPPRLTGEAKQIRRRAGETSSDLVRRLVRALDHGVLPVQGPPGAGKTYLGARMICELVKAGKRVGVTAVSHKVIRNLLDAALKAAHEENLELSCIHKVGRPSDELPKGLSETKDNPPLLEAIKSGAAQVAGATAWAWAREDFVDSVDVLIVDEAGQMSLADTLAAAPSAKSLVLLGDPQQLEQPIQGSHPDGCAASALEHLLDGEQTMPEDKGLFLAETWRLHPSICAFTSELFYEGRLDAHPGRERQRLDGDTPYAGAGLWHVPVEHHGNQSCSTEEVEVVESIFRSLTSGRVSWTDPKGDQKKLERADVLIVAPYNLQVNALSRRLADARVGTVDKFQGQEAPVVIYSMTTSSPEDAPRGMEFLYSLNRLNVATSRARCAVILVASPRLLEPECKTPAHMKLANALCRFAEMAVR